MSERARAVVAGWNGFIGRRLVADLAEREYDVARVGRTGPDGRWSDPRTLTRLVDSDLPGTRRVALRMAIVLGGPPRTMLARVARLGLDGPSTTVVGSSTVALVPAPSLPRHR